MSSPKPKKRKRHSDWDIDSYRTDYESEEHWLLRRKFIEAHKDKFEEDRLVCLAQVFINVEFMGCKYPDETMRMVAELSAEVAKDFRKERATKLKRTFVSASDAAESRAKGGDTTKVQQNNPKCTKDKMQSTSKDNFKICEHFVTGESNNFDEPEKKKRKCSDIFADLPYNELVLLLNTGRNCLRISTQQANINYEEKEACTEDGKKQVHIYIGGKVVAHSIENTLKEAKKNAFYSALEELQKNCYSIKLNPLRDAIKIDKSDEKVVCDVIKSEVISSDQKLDSTNKGYKIMKMMGWTGGGLGLKTQGREDPVSYLLKNNRAGLGNDVTKLDRNYFSQMLKNYIESDDIRELQFESAFTKEERAILHEIASRFNLKSTSHGKDENRRLIISKKNISKKYILTEILVNNNPSYSDQYFVQVPESKAHLYPQYTAKLDLDA